jgi:hypothetical protein
VYVLVNILNCFPFVCFEFETNKGKTIQNINKDVHMTHVVVRMDSSDTNNVTP